MATKGEKIEVHFESHPPIEKDLAGVATLLKQTLLQLADCHSLARYLIEQKDLTQVIAQASSEDDASDDDEPDDDIYGVSSVIELPIKEAEADGKTAYKSRAQLLRFISDRCPQFKDILDGAQKEDKEIKVIMIVNERYINLPPQLSLPTLKTLTEGIKNLNYTHLILISKVLLRSRNSDTKLPSKKSKSSTKQDAEPTVFINPEEEIISEQSDFYTDVDVSAHCDENATWSFSSDIKYVPHRRILVVSFKKWQSILNSLEKELS